MPQALDLLDERFGKLLVLARVGSRHGASLWLVRCDCGATLQVESGSLRKGKRTSCGCGKRERMRALAIERNTTHGLSHLPEYRVWKSMRRRCDYPAHVSFRYYGGRGVCVCRRWGSFAAFYRDMGPRPSPQHSIERRNNDGNYTPSNCYWATPKQQAANRRRRSTPAELR